MWFGNALPAALGKSGHESDRQHPFAGQHGRNYKPLSDSDWQELGASDPGSASGDYKLQVGDLDNRSSLQFIDRRSYSD
ncbi:outer membrane protein assembly factor BamC [Escherichia coli]